MANKCEVQAGGDPRKVKAPAFGELCDRYYRLHSGSWKPSTVKSWLVTQKHLANLPPLQVDAIEPWDVLTTLTPLFRSGASVAPRTRQAVRSVLDLAVVGRWIADNPAGDSPDAALPQSPRETKHHAHLHWNALPEAMATVAALPVSAKTLALRLLAHTAVRSSEVLGMAWSEVDQEARLWTLPASRTKAKRQHRVPLNDQAMAILEDAKSLHGGKGLVFPGRKPGKGLNDKSLSAVSGIECTVHGLRGTFMTWAQDHDVPHEVRERRLAHVVGSQVTQAYAHSDLLDQRREVMQAWAEYIG